MMVHISKYTILIHFSVSRGKRGKKKNKQRVQNLILVILIYELDD
jgi:hypothetical protein